MSFVQLELNGVITSSDGLYVKVNKLIHLNTADVVKVND